MNLAPRVLVLAGGLSHERDVSLRSGRRVAEALRDGGCTVVERDVDAGLIGLLSGGTIDVVWPLLHGASGEDGAIATWSGSPPGGRFNVVGPFLHGASGEAGATATCSSSSRCPTSARRLQPAGRRGTSP